MKAFKTILLLTITFSCNNDNSSVASIPEITSLEKLISSQPGLEFTIEGMLSDPAGIKTIQLKYDAWSLDKTITKGDLPTSYNLSYSFMVPESEITGSSHIVDIVVTNSGGGQTSATVVVTLDKDVVAPNIVVNGLANGATIVMGAGDEIIFDIDISDQELSEFKIESTLLNETIPLSGITYTYMNSLNIEEAGVYDFVLTATDLSGNVTVKNISVSVVNELKFLTMYITELTDNTSLEADLFGVPYPVPLATDPSEEGFVFRAKYYTATATTEVRFIPQKNSFEPFAFGADTNSPGTLVLGVDASVSPIVLDEGAGYYQVTIDLRDLSYSVTKYTPGDAPFDGFYIAGIGPVVGGTDLCADGCWNHTSALPFVVDPNNPYRWSQDVTFAAESGGGNTSFIFVGNTAGWSPFWRLNAGSIAGVDAIVPNGGVELFYLPEHYGNYKIIVDTHLNTFTAHQL